MSNIAALVSGGVDSAVALAKYIEDHPEKKSKICAYYLKIWLEDELSFLGECPWEEDLEYAQKVADQVGVPLKIVSLQREYHDLVVSYTIDELKAGRTPSPDIFCNHFIKFGAFLERINDVAHVISGHYAQVLQEPARLFRSPDPIKDQTYFLSHLDYQQLSRIHLPLGEMKKSEARDYAASRSLAPSQRKDSQGICFLGKIKYTDFVKYHLGTKEGPIIDIASRKKLGTHNGTWFYTIGQRTGIGLGGGPWYVAKKSLEHNTLWVRHGVLSNNQITKDVPVTQLHLINPSTRDTLLDADGTLQLDDISIKIRHGEKISKGTLQFDIKKNSGLVHINDGDTGIADGQFTVIYKGEECLGCAKIDTSLAQKMASQ